MKCISKYYFFQLCIWLKLRKSSRSTSNLDSSPRYLTGWMSTLKSTTPSLTHAAFYKKCILSGCMKEVLSGQQMQLTFSLSTLSAGNGKNKSLGFTHADSSPEKLIIADNRFDWWSEPFTFVSLKSYWIKCYDKDNRLMLGYVKDCFLISVLTLMNQPVNTEFLQTYYCLNAWLLTEKVLEFLNITDTP